MKISQLQMSEVEMYEEKSIKANLLRCMKMSQLQMSQFQVEMYEDVIQLHTFALQGRKVRKLGKFLPSYFESHT